MKAELKEIRAKMFFHQEQARKYKDAIIAFQEICEHKWNFQGHGHNSTFCTCMKCGKEKEE